VAIRTADAPSAEATVESNGSLAVRGVLSFDTVPDVYARSTAWIQGARAPISIDLQGVKHADSAGLGLPLEWLHLAQRQNRQLRFVNVPEQVRSLARVNGLGKAIGVVDR